MVKWGKKEPENARNLAKKWPKFPKLLSILPEIPWKVSGNTEPNLTFFQIISQVTRQKNLKFYFHAWKYFMVCWLDFMWFAFWLGKLHHQSYSMYLSSRITHSLWPSWFFPWLAAYFSIRQRWKRFHIKQQTTHLP